MCNFLWIEKLTSPGKNIKLDKNGQKEEEEWGRTPEGTQVVRDGRRRRR